MPEKQTHHRAMCLRESEDFFFAAVNRPFPKEKGAFRMMAALAYSVHHLDEGSEVFVYQRSLFQGNGESDSLNFAAHMENTTQKLGNISLDLLIQPIAIEDKSSLEVI